MRRESHTHLTFPSLVRQEVLPVRWLPHSISTAIRREGKEEGRKIEGLELWKNSMQRVARRAVAPLPVD